MRINRLQAEAMGRAVGYIGFGFLAKWLHITDQNEAILVSVAGEAAVMGLALYQTRRRAVANALLDMETKRTDDDGVLVSPNGGKDAHVMTVPKARHLANNIDHTKKMLQELTKKGYKDLPIFDEYSYSTRSELPLADEETPQETKPSENDHKD